MELKTSDNTPFGFHPLSWSLALAKLRFSNMYIAIRKTGKYLEKEVFEAEQAITAKGYDPSLPGFGLSTEGINIDIAISSRKYFMEATVIMLYAMTEKELHGICNSVYENTEQGASPSQKGHINDSKEYLKATCDLNWDQFDPEWAFIKDLGSIRNSYAHHHDGCKIKKRAEIFKKHTGQGELSAQFIESTFNHVGNFFKKLRLAIWLPVYEKLQDQPQHNPGVDQIDVTEHKPPF